MDEKELLKELKRIHRLASPEGCLAVMEKFVEELEADDELNDSDIFWASKAAVEYVKAYLIYKNKYGKLKMEDAQ